MRLIFPTALVLYFFGCLLKVAVPSSVFAGLQADGYSIGLITGLGAGFMYAYSLSQFLMGLFVDRLGAMRSFLLGGALVVSGCLLFPIGKYPSLLLTARILQGFGAGTVFLALTKLLAELFPRQFAGALGIILFVGYLGPVVGGLPTVALVENFGWKAVMGGIALILLLAYLLFLFAQRKIPVSSGSQQSLWTTAKENFQRTGYLRLMLFSGMAFGIYYAFLTVVGQKCLEEIGALSRYRAATCMSLLMLMVACCNLLVVPLQKLCRWLHLRACFFLSLFGVAGVGLALLALQFHLPASLLVVALFLLALPAGFFSLYSAEIKELCPPDSVGMAVSQLNFSAFVGIAVMQHLAGVILAHAQIPGQTAIPAIGYQRFCRLALVAALLSLFVSLMPAGKRYESINSGANEAR